MGAPNLATITKSGVTLGRTITPSLPIIITNTPNSGKSIRVNQIVVTNVSAAPVTVTLSLYKSGWYRFLPSITVPPFNTYELISKSVYIEENCKIAVIPSVDNVVNAVISYDDITDSATISEYIDNSTRYTILSLTSEDYSNSNSRLFNSDLSVNNSQISVIGNTQPSNCHPYSGAYYSTYFNGSTDYLSVPNYSGLILAGGMWTIEMWVFLTGDRSTYKTLLTKSTSFRLNIQVTTGYLNFYNGTNYTSTTPVPFNSWTHIAYVYTGTNIILYINGVSVLNSAVAITEVNSPVLVGNVSGLTEYFSGYIADLRVVKGTQVYTSNFTPPDSPVSAASGNTTLLMCNSNRFLDSSSSNSIISVTGTPKITHLTPYNAPSQYYSSYFDGSTGYLSVPNSTPLNLVGSTWTIDCWLYLTSDRSTYRTIIAKRVTSTGTTSYEVYVRITTGVLSFYNGTNYESSTVVPMYCWTHVACVYTGTNVVLYMNGVQVMNTAVTITEQDQPVVIGTARGYAEYFGGYISGMRVVKGSILYTGNFTPPAIPTQVVSNTSLLTCVGSSHIKNAPCIDTSMYRNAVSSINNPSLTSANPYGTNWSMYFNGSSDYLSIPNSANLVLAGSVWTIEMWVFLTGDRTKHRTFLTKRVTNTNTTSYQLFSTITTGALSFYNGTEYNSTGIVPLNKWTHVACVYTGTNVVLYMNGVQVMNTAVTITEVNEPVIVGYTRSASTTWLEGYISDLRIVKGTQVYTSNFNPPIAPVSAISGTALLLGSSNRFVDVSTTNSVVTVNGTPKIIRYSPYVTLSQQYYPKTFSGSVYFNGSNYISMTSFPGVAFKDNNFTIEMWIYSTATTTTAWNPIFTIGTSGGGKEIRIAQNTNATGQCGFLVPNATSTADVYTGTVIGVLPKFEWTHLALVRVGSVITFYKNGVAAATITGQTFSFLGGPVQLGYGWYSGDGYFTGGYISDLRIVNNNAVYTSNFTPPTSALTPIANTAFLIDYTPPIANNAMANTSISNIGDTLLTEVEKYSGNKSLYFDGVGDYLTLTDMQPGYLSGDFTVEAWCTCTTALKHSVFSGSYRTFLLSLNQTLGKVSLFIGNGASWLVTDFQSTSTFTPTVWNHIAVTRSGTTFTIYINGVSSGSVTGTPAGYTQVAWIGAYNATEYYNGYIDNLRFVVGTPLYTSNFTPPTRIVNVQQ